ncbi:MAG: aspartate aminotransferase family protein [Actinobacteria bacterium]|nr:aspartate aminotransferase family protein [Actinomycetota bacterium]
MPTDVDIDRLLARAGEIEKLERETTLARTRASAALHGRAVRSMPLGVASSFQANDPYPIYLERGRGSRVWDVDGNEYVDYHNGFGTMAVGHAHPRVVEAIERAAGEGTHFAVTTEAGVALAEELCRRFRLERVRFSNSGTEATMDALRVARAASGRDGVIKIEGSYHGHHDQVMFSVVPSMYELGEPERPASTPFSRGIPGHTADDLVVVPFNDADALRRVLDEDASRDGGPRIGTMIIEPVMMNIGIVPPNPGYLEAVRELCTRHGVVLVFDEVKCGATIAPGGAIELYGVQPDLACFAKAIGGGVPIGAFGGTAAVMDEIGHGVAHQGTFNGNPLAMRAGLATLTEVLTDDAYRRFAELGSRMASGCRAALEANGIPAHVRDFGCKGNVSYRAEPLTQYRDYLECHEGLFYASWGWVINRGVFMTPGDEEQWTISVQHTEADIDRYVEAYASFCTALAK